MPTGVKIGNSSGLWCVPSRAAVLALFMRHAIQFAAIFFWEWIPQYPFPWLTAISIICLADNGRHDFVRNLFGAGSSNEGIGLLSFSTSWTLITQGNPLVWPLQTRELLTSSMNLLKLTSFVIEVNSFSTILILIFTEAV